MPHWTAYLPLHTTPATPGDYIALLDRLTHRVHILEMNGESYRFKESLRRHGKKTQSKSEQRKEENQE